MKYIEYGKENSEVIMMLHGGGLSWWNYRKEAELLCDEYHIIWLYVNSWGKQKKGSVLMILENRKKKRLCVNSRGDKARIFYYDIYACNCTELLCFDDYVLQAYNLSIPDFK